MRDDRLLLNDILEAIARIERYASGSEETRRAPSPVIEMKQPYLEVSFRRGRPLAAYLYLPRQPGAKSYRAKEASPGMVIDFDLEGRPIGIEITAPTKVSLSEINATLQRLGHDPMTQADLAPLQAA